MTWDEGDEVCGCDTCRVLAGVPPGVTSTAYRAEWRANIREAIQHGEPAHGDLARRVMPPLRFEHRETA